MPAPDRPVPDRHPPAPASPDGRPRLLLVDDEAVFRQLTQAMLESADWSVRTCSSAEEALQSLQTESPAPAEVVLMDIGLGGMDGIEACRRIRQHHPAWPPVLLLTADTAPELLQRAYAAGAVDFITKPVDWDLLDLRLRRARASAGEQRELASSRARLQRAQKLARLVSWQLDADGRLHGAEALSALHRWPGRPRGRHAPLTEAGIHTLLPLLRHADRQRLLEARQRALHEGRPYALQYELQLPDGACRTLVERGISVRDRHDPGRRVEGVTQDITERVSTERRLRQLTRYDDLTMLPNRSHFTELCAAELERARANGRGCALLHLDIDRFRSVNDALGRTGGDQVLATLAQRLRTAIRQTGGDARDPDDAGLHDRIARLGPNAFGVLLGGLTEPTLAAAAAERLIREVQRPLEIDGRRLQLDAGAGIALSPRDGMRPTELLAHAEQALYAAKRAGRGRLQVYDPGLHAEAQARLQREHELRQAIQGGQLRLHLQPKVDSVSRRIIGVEALVRWQHPQRGLVMPGEFIGLAEETGLIAPLTDWVLEAACRTLHDWRRDGRPGLPISVNVAGPQLLDDALYRRMDELVRRHDVPPQLLVVEVTESMLMADTDAAIASLDRLRQRGFRLSLDDFGTGWSSLAQVKRLPLDELKIDRAFIRDLACGPRDSALVAAIITLARLLDLQVVAEGVETPQQAAVLRQLGCSLHQGFLYARPAPAGLDLPDIAGRVDGS
ncbi:MAG: hypothetical protein RIQ53_2503 [Pseudomonadota bacterium]